VAGAQATRNFDDTFRVTRKITSSFNPHNAHDNLPRLSNAKPVSG